MSQNIFIFTLKISIWSSPRGIFW